MKQKRPIIIISGNKNINDYLGIIYKLGKYHDEMAIRFMENYAEMVEALLFGLRKSFGWLQESDIKQIEDTNKKCIYFDDDITSKPGEPIKRGLDYAKCKNKDSTYTSCTFQVRSVCKFYQQKDTTKFLINEVIIKKHGALRGL